MQGVRHRQSTTQAGVMMQAARRSARALDAGRQHLLQSEAKLHGGGLGAVGNNQGVTVARGSGWGSCAAGVSECVGDPVVAAMCEECRGGRCTQGLVSI
jgi:hypothetical protein